jgi:hypothetical protein
MRKMPHPIIILDCHLEGVKYLSRRLDGASPTMYGTCLYDERMSRYVGLVSASGLAYIVENRYQIILVSRHTQLCDDILICSPIHDSSVGCLNVLAMVIIDVVHSWSVPTF